MLYSATCEATAKTHSLIIKLFAIMRGAPGRTDCQRFWRRVENSSILITCRQCAVQYCNNELLEFKKKKKEKSTHNGSAWLAAKCWHRRHAHCTAIYELCPRNCYCTLRTCCQGSHFSAAGSDSQLCCCRWQLSVRRLQLQLVALRHATAIKFVECPPNWQ